MSAKNLKAFLDAVGFEESSGDIGIINTYNYIGKYQFGEQALMQLGYYKTTAEIKKKQEWKGHWTGKNGATSREVFLADEAMQDKAGEEWMRELCRQGRYFGTTKFIGQTMKGFVVTESGIIAAAHLKGYGPGKPDKKTGQWVRPAVLAFLRTGGAEDGTDAYGSSVSKYMKKFGGYELGCCAPVEAQTTWMYPFPRQGKSDAFDGAMYLGLPAQEEGALARVDDGFFPVGASGLWHGGVHFDAGSGTVLDQTQGVRCIKDGEVVAYRIDERYPEITFPQVQRKALYSKGFVLVRHTLKLPADAQAKFEAADKAAKEAQDKKVATAADSAPAAPQTAAAPAAAATAPSKAVAPAPATKTAKDSKDSKDSKPAAAPEPGTELSFYSLYMHLMDFTGYQEDRKRARPGFWTEGNEFVVGEKAKDAQEVPPAPAAAQASIDEDDHIGCDCGGTSGESDDVADALEQLGWGPGQVKEWDNVVQEAHADE
ncbi:hypothetical protein I5U23_15040 [Stenotrophomonas maltophilia]|uniref:Uncharacterized protein n=1 Tax=Stenotrophomonas riyadhensis TaxID=2859893 RepID=A0ABT2XDH7_9GAMM|nr:hypothetical protein [Stenotrophomonas sp. CFS3442]MBH1619233.1 hypothetical protein [Stenotrophomonas maltophilia]MCV0323977.1 hypothetical protein [Stenotrophomonas sp. CFS3442]HEL4243603.1 hypothetical protein [Stenotrophomonas maltophilia]